MVDFILGWAAFYVTKHFTAPKASQESNIIFEKMLIIFLFLYNYFILDLNSRFSNVKNGRFHSENGKIFMSWIFMFKNYQICPYVSLIVKWGSNGSIDPCFNSTRPWIFLIAIEWKYSRLSPNKNSFMFQMDSIGLLNPNSHIIYFYQIEYLRLSSQWF